MYPRPIVLLAALGACAPKAPGSKPHEMSRAEHEAAARQHEEAAVAEVDPQASAAGLACGPAAVGATARVCWTSVTDPTEEQREAAGRELEVAARHRAASAALASAEEQACAGLAPEDRDASPFAHTEDIATVAPLTEPRRGGKAGAAEELTGAIVTFHAVPGLTAEWLQRIVDCHLARNSALGHDVPEMPDCPLVPKGADAEVSSTGTGFAVAIRGDDEATAQEILARARRLHPAAAAIQ